MEGRGWRGGCVAFELGFGLVHNWLSQGPPIHFASDLLAGQSRAGQDRALRSILHNRTAGYSHSFLSAAQK